MSKWNEEIKYSKKQWIFIIIISVIFYIALEITVFSSKDSHIKVKKEVAKIEETNSSGDVDLEFRKYICDTKDHLKKR